MTFSEMKIKIKDPMWMLKYDKKDTFKTKALETMYADLNKVYLKRRKTEMILLLLDNEKNVK